MKSKSSYFMLIGGIVLLLVVAALLSGVLFDLSVPEPAVEKTVVAQEKSTPVIGESTIILGKPDSTQPAQVSRIPSSVSERMADTRTQKKDIPEPAALSSIGAADYVSGQAYATAANRHRRRLAKGSRVFLNDRVETGPASRIELVFNDKTTVSQGENSVIVLDEYVFDPSKQSESKFSMRFLRGTCRVITGLITEFNPERFKVRTRMATIGIRGCDLAFKTGVDQDDIRILEIRGKERIHIETTVDGRQMLNMLSGANIPVAPARRRVITVTEPQTLVFITRGEGATQRPLGMEEMRAVVNETSAMSPAKYGIIQKRDGAVFTLKPNAMQNGQGDGQ